MSTVSSGLPWMTYVRWIHRQKGSKQSSSKKNSLYCEEEGCSTLNSKSSVGKTVLLVRFFSLIIAEVADWSRRKQNDKQVSKVGTGAAALLSQSCHWYTVGRQLKWAYVAR